MNTNNMRTCSALTAALLVAGASLAADIQYAASGSSGTYGGQGFGIAVDVATPASGATIQYSTSENGPWRDEEIKYTNACPATPIWFKISAEGYSSVTNSRTVAIAPKQLTDEFVWLTLPTQGYEYDGTAKTPKFTCVDGYPSIITSNDVGIAFTDNVNAGTAKATFTGKRNYTGTVEEEFDILARPLTIVADAKSKTYGTGDPPLTYTATGLVAGDAITGALTREAGNAAGTYAILQGTLTAGDNYDIDYTGANFTINPATIQYAASGSSGTYCGQGFGIAVDVATPASGATIQYSTSENGPWQDEEIKYTNACPATPIWFKISAEGYSSVTNSRTVAIAPKQLTDEFVWLTLPTQGYEYDGTAKTPKFTCVDGYPSIITSNDVDIAFTDNVNAGTAKATFTGKRNYTGTVEEEFDILARPLTIVADAKSKTYGAADPALTYTATGLVAGDAISGALTRDAGNAVGTYAILQGTLAAGDNYDIDYTGANFTIEKASFPGGGEEPGEGEVPGDGLSKFDTTAVYDGLGHTIDTNALASAFRTAVGGACNVRYAVGAALSASLPWTSTPPNYTNVGEYVVFYRVGSQNYEDFMHGAKVTITPRPLSIVADDAGKEQGADDPALTYTATGLVVSDVLSGVLAREAGEAAGTYAILQGTLTAGGNYEIAFTGAVFTITDSTPQLPGATIKWKFSSAVGRYFAQISIPAAAGYADKLNNLAFLFADRKSSDGTIYAQLWDTAARAPCGILVTDGGVEYRGVPLDASAFAGKADGTRVVFGVSDATFAEARKIVPAGERQVGLYVRRRVSPVSGNETDGEVESFVGYLTWTTNGTRYFLPVVEGAANGAVSTQAKRSAPMHSSLSFAAMPHAYAPQTLGLAVSLGLNAVSVSASNPKMKIAAFEVCADGSIRGRVEAVAGYEASSTFAPSASVRVLAAETPAGPWREVRAKVDPSTGTFALPVEIVAGHFFRAEVDTSEVFE